MRARVHGDPARFETVATFVAQRYGRGVRYVADVAGGQGLLARALRKRHNYVAEVVDPRAWRVRGTTGEVRAFTVEDATYYDLVVGLHPDEATRAVAESALVRPVVLVPCCNFWDRTRRLGRDALLTEIEAFYRSRGVTCERAELGFQGPMNIALVSSPPTVG